MRILVTGGSGLIGAAVVRTLVARGHEVRLLARHADAAAASYAGGVQPMSASIDDADALAVAVRGCSAIVHLAGILTEEPPETTYEKVNVRGTAELLKAASGAGAPFFVQVSSLGAERGASEYHRSKLRAEEHVRTYPGPWVILRPGNIYGPGDETVSTLLKLLRSLPTVPVVDDGEQDFQPMWCDDFAEAVARTLERRDLAWRVLELTGPETTNTNDLLRRLGALTGRQPSTVSVPRKLARAGARVVERLGGDAALRALGLESPLSSAKLQLLLEQTVLEPERNALTTVLRVAPTPLDEGLAMLVDALPEQLPTEGVGALSARVYSTEIQRSARSAEELIEEVAEHLGELMPLELPAEPGSATSAERGATLTGDLPLRGHFQVRVEERTPRSFTFVTIEGHPLAGAVTFSAEPLSEGRLRFDIRVISRPADVFDWVAMRTIGGILQARNWRAVARRVVQLSGGTAPDGVRDRKIALSAEETERWERWAEEIVAARKRSEHEAELARTGTPPPDQS